MALQHAARSPQEQHHDSASHISATEDQAEGHAPPQQQQVEPIQEAEILAAALGGSACTCVPDSHPQSAEKAPAARESDIQAAGKRRASHGADTAPQPSPAAQQQQQRHKRRRLSAGMGQVPAGPSSVPPVGAVPAAAQERHAEAAPAQKAAPVKSLSARKGPKSNPRKQAQQERRRAVLQAGADHRRSQALNAIRRSVPVRGTLCAPRAQRVQHAPRAPAMRRSSPSDGMAPNQATEVQELREAAGQAAAVAAAAAAEARPAAVDACNGGASAGGPHAGVPAARDSSADTGGVAGALLGAGHVEAAEEVPAQRLRDPYSFPTDSSGASRLLQDPARLRAGLKPLPPWPTKQPPVNRRRSVPGHATREQPAQRPPQVPVQLRTGGAQLACDRAGPGQGPAAAAAAAAGAGGDRPQRAKRLPTRYNDLEAADARLGASREGRLAAEAPPAAPVSPPRPRLKRLRRMQEGSLLAPAEHDLAMAGLQDDTPAPSPTKEALQSDEEPAAAEAGGKRRGEDASKAGVQAKRRGVGQDAAEQQQRQQQHARKRRRTNEEVAAQEPGRAALPGLDPDQAAAEEPQQPAAQPSPPRKRAKLGCSKCRHSKTGCGACRGRAGGASPPHAASPRQEQAAKGKRASLPAAPAAPHRLQEAAAKAAQRRRSEPAAAHAHAQPRMGAFAGMRFLVTSFEDGGGRAGAEALLREQGGAVEADLPAPGDGRLVHAVVAGRMSERKPKFLYARVAGCPLVKRAFLDRCVAAGRFLQPRPEELWAATGGAAQAFQGRSIFLDGDRSFVKPFGALLQLAGAKVVPRLETTTKLHSPRKHGLMLDSAVLSFVAADLAIVNAPEPLHQQQSLQSLLRQARRLGVPVISLKAATDALISGDASALPARPSMTSGLSSPGQQQQPRRRSGSGVGGSSCGEAAAAQAGRDVAEALVADSESFGQGAPAGAAGGRAKRRLSTDSVSQPRPGAASPRMTAPAAASVRPAHAEAPAQPAAAAQPGAAAAAAAAVAGGNAAGGLQWLEALEGPPEGLGLQPSAHCTYYAAVRRGSEVMRVSDDVEMVAPGEPHSAVVRIQALWSERPQDGRERMLARTQRYYRPRETGFPGATTGQNELFASPEVSQRVSAELLLRRVRVARRSMGADVADITGDAAFCCMFSYDPVAYTLGLLPASEL